jgi:hypothetical protein
MGDFPVPVNRFAALPLCRPVVTTVHLTAESHLQLSLEALGVVPKRSPMLPTTVDSSTSDFHVRIAGRGRERALCGGMLVALLAMNIGSLSAANSAKDDDDDFNAVIRKVYDPYRMNDLRIGYTMLPAGARIRIIDRTDELNSANYHRDTNWDQTGRTGLMWMTPWSKLLEDGEFIVGLEASTNHLIINEGPNSPLIDLRTYQLTVHPGIGWLLDTNFHVEVNPYFSAGIGEYEQSKAGSGSDPYFEGGLRGAGYYTWRSGLQLGLQMAYHYGRLKGEMGNYDVHFVMQGVTLGLQLGYRL